MDKTVLKNLSKGKLSPKEAYDLIYRIKLRKARFLRLSVTMKKHKITSLFINTLFILPIPLVFGKPLIKIVLKNKTFASDESNDMFMDIYYIVKYYSGGSKVYIKTDSETIKLSLY